MTQYDAPWHLTVIQVATEVVEKRLKELGRSKAQRRARLAELKKNAPKQVDPEWIIEWISLGQGISPLAAANQLLAKLADGTLPITGERISDGVREQIPPSAFAIRLMRRRLPLYYCPDDERSFRLPVKWIEACGRELFKPGNEPALMAKLAGYAETAGESEVAADLRAGKGGVCLNREEFEEFFSEVRGRPTRLPH